MSKYQKTVKVLSDGTIAKVGMIVVHELEERPGRIVALRSGDDPSHEMPNCISVIWLHNRTSVGYKRSYRNLLEYMRKATPEERKLYYQSKWQQHV